MQLSLSSGHAVRQCGLHPRGLPAEVPTAARAQTRRCCREPSSSSFSAIRTPNIAESQVTRLPTADVPDTAGGSGSRNGSKPRDLDLLQQRRESELHASTSGVAVAEEVTQSTVERLVSSGNPALSMAEIASAFKFPLDDFQKQAVEDILAGHSVVVCAPTGAGKTAIAEAATIAVLARGQRIVYTSPLKALSNQKLQEMRLQFGFERVGLQTGDACLNAEGDIVVMTTEVLRNIMYRTAGPNAEKTEADARMKDIGLIVLDEVHYLGDPERGSVWEEVIINAPKDVPLLCMSATVANPDDLGGWISKVHGSCKTVVTHFRPVPLSFRFCHTTKGETKMLPLLTSKGRLNPELDRAALAASDDEEEEFYEPRGFGRPHRRKRGSRLMKEAAKGTRVPCVEEALELLQAGQLLPTIWFTFSRMGCDNAAVRLHTQGVSLATPADRDVICKAVAALKEDQPEAIREMMLPPLEYGIASHHAGCLPAWKSMVEDLYKQGVIKVVFATGTLAAGINMPARSTVISAISRRVSSGHVMLKHNELLQMAGRAGRRGFDTKGHCVVLQDRFDEPRRVVSILQQGPEPLQSHFATGYGMVLKLLHHRSLDFARAFVERSFFNYLADEGVQRREKAIEAALEEAASLLEQAKQAEASAGGTDNLFEAYLRLKEQYQEARKNERKVMRAAARMRGQQAAELLAGATLPVAVGLESMTLDLYEETSVLPALLVASEPNDPDLGPQQSCSYLCLSSDNRLVKVQAKHIAAVAGAEHGMLPSAADIQPIRAAAKSISAWEHLKSGSFFAQGSGLTAGIAARITGQNLQHIRLSDEAQSEISEANEAVTTKKELAKEAQQAAKKVKAYRPDLQLRAEATKLKRRAREMQLALGDSSKRKETNWRSFESTLRVLVKAGALDPASLQATALGQAAREVSALNELWMAMVLTHSSVQNLSPQELAAVVCSMIAAELPTRTTISVQYGCSSTVLEAIEAMEGDRERLYYLQMDAGISASLVVDLRLAGVVEAWTAGADWKQVMSDCSLDGGDVARLLSRTTDILRQAARCTSLLPAMRATARSAASSMSRKPITDLIQ